MQEATDASNPTEKRLSVLSNPSSQTDSVNFIISGVSSPYTTPSHAQQTFPEQKITLSNPSGPEKDSSSEEDQNNLEVAERGRAISFGRPHVHALQREPQLVQPNEFENISSHILQVNNVENRPANADLSISIGNEESTHEDVIAQNLYLIMKKLAWFKFWRALVIYTMTFLGSMLLSFIKDLKISSYMSIYVLAYAFLIYYLAEHIVKSLSNDILPWKKTENIYDAIDISIAIIFLFFIQLTFSGVNIATKWILILFVLSMIGYCIMSKAPDVHKHYQISKRVLIGVQILLIAVKIDGDITWLWLTVLYFVILCLTFVAICFFGLLALLIYVIISPLLNRRVFAHFSRSTIIFGFVWSVFYSALAISIMTGILALAIHIDNEDSISGSVINVCLLIVRYLSLALIALTASAYNYILNYLAEFDLEKHFYEEELTPPDMSRDPSKFVRERKTTYFVRLSSTYFSPLNISAGRKSDTIKQKNAMRQIRNRRFLRKLPNPEDSVNQDLNLDDSISGKNLQNNALKLAEDHRQDLEDQAKIDIQQKFREREFFSEADRENPVLSVPDLKKVCLSDDFRPNEFSEKEPVKTSENLCYICYEKRFDAIFSECGHGGICTNCALEIVHTKGQCMQCRENVTKVIRIEPGTQLQGIVRGYETLTIVSNK